MDEKKTEDFKISIRERRFVEALASGESRKCALISAGFKVAHLETKTIEGGEKYDSIFIACSKVCGKRGSDSGRHRRGHLHVQKNFKKI